MISVEVLPPQYDRQSVVCTARALDGTLTVPASLLAALPPGEPTLDRSPFLRLGLSRPATIERLPRRNADPVPAIVQWQSSALLFVTLR